MKKKALLVVLGTLLTLGSYQLVSNMGVDVGNDAFAIADGGAWSAACTDPSQAAYTPEIAYTVTWSAAAAGSAPSPSATAVLTGAVNGESAPSVTATLNGSGATGGNLILTGLTPRMKHGGLQCQFSSSASRLEAHGDGSDNTSFDIAISNIADADNAYTAGDQVDNAPSATKDVLFGTAGQISTSNLSDSSDDDSTDANGEIVFGTAEVNGGSEIHIKMDVTNYDVQAANEVETVVMSFTGF